MENKDYQNWPKTELIKEIKRLKKRKKYGLVWEDKPEEVVEMCKEKLPIVKEVKNKEIITDKNKPVNLLIEGDNYHALSVLNYTHEKKIDVIYIDPPFNTGSRSWKFNNNYVDKEDTFRHSKWISFMYSRLKIARNILKESGVALVAIDDYETATLRLLMDELYGENNRLGTIVVVHNPGGRSDDEFVATSHEYMLVYAKNRGRAKINPLPFTEKQLEEYKYEDDISKYKLQSFKRTGSNSRREDRPNLYYPIFYNPRTKKISLKQETREYIKILPLDTQGKDRVWRWSKEYVAKKLTTEFNIVSKNDKFNIYVKKRYLGNSDEGSKPKTFWFGPKYNASTYGTILLQNILHKDKPFDYPKSLYTVIDALLISGDKNSLICDFFAGSGTTGHAVLHLNKEDSGNRKFILCTNNENNNGGDKIAEDICYPRLKKVIEGYKNLKGEWVEGLGGNLKYFKTDFVDAEPTDKNKRKLTDQVTEMICIKEGTFEPVLDRTHFKIFKNNNHYAGIILDQLVIPEFKKVIKDINGKFSIYVFSLSDETFDEEFSDVKQKIKLSPIPEAILMVYRRIIR
jgi:adenine-specific DNA-methyltransferase